jgi:1,6-anhydro-N-acetylmuramate kinase
MQAEQSIGERAKVVVNKFATVPYTKETKDKIPEVFARQHVNFEELCLLNPYIGMLHGEMALNCLRRWRFPVSKVDIIASHGQTVFHSPSFLHPKEKIKGTLRISVIICQVYLIYIYNINVVKLSSADLLSFGEERGEAKKGGLT